MARGSARHPAPAVVHVIPALAAGGAESVVLALAIGRTRLGYPTSVIVVQPGPSVTPHPLVHELRRNGVTTYEVRCGRRAYRQEARNVTEHVRAMGADLVHAHKFRGNVAGYLAAQRCHLPVVATAHGYSRRDLRTRFYGLLDRRLLRSFDAVICVSRPLQLELTSAGLDATRLHCIPNGDLGVSRMPRDAARAALRLPADTLVVGWIGRLDREKAPERAIALAPAILRSGGVLAMIGGGPSRPGVEHALRRLELPPGSVRLLGEQPGAGSLIAAFDLVCLTSLTEGTPAVVLECMAAGVPVASVGVGGIPQLLDDSCGWIVPPGDVQALERAVTHALGDPAERSRRGGAARQRLASRFSTAGWLAAIEDVYTTAIRTRHSPEGGPSAST